jgi:hypothetical protein
VFESRTSQVHRIPAADVRHGVEVCPAHRGSAPVVTDVREHVHPCGPCPGRFGFGMFTFGRSSSVGASDVVASSVVGGQLGRCRRIGFGCGEERRSASCGVRNDLELAGGGSTEQPL